MKSKLTGDLRRRPSTLYGCDDFAVISYSFPDVLATEDRNCKRVLPTIVAHDKDDKCCR